MDSFIKYDTNKHKHIETKILFNFASHYEDVNDKKNTIKYYLQAIENNCVEAMFNFALFHENNKNTKEMIKYYLMAIKHGCIESMYNLAYYYYKANNPKKMKKYCLMSINNGDKKGGLLLFHYCENIEKLKIKVIRSK
jgi:TPR repeat protein